MLSACPPTQDTNRTDSTHHCQIHTHTHTIQSFALRNKNGNTLGTDKLLSKVCISVRKHTFFKCICVGSGPNKSHISKRSIINCIDSGAFYVMNASIVRHFQWPRLTLPISKQTYTANKRVSKMFEKCSAYIM